MMRHKTITKHNKNQILAKANSLCNDAVPLKQILNRCHISYHQLLKLSKEDAWDADVIFRFGYKSSPVWFSKKHTQKLREFAYRQYVIGDMTISQIAWLLGRSDRTIYRYIDIEKKKQKQTEKNTEI
jgi:hypothetical protein